MLKLLSEQPLIRWALGAVGIVGAGVLAYILIFGQPRGPSELAAPAAIEAPENTAALADTAFPVDTAGQADTPAPSSAASLAEPEAAMAPQAPAELAALPAPTALSDGPDAGGMPPEDAAPDMRTALAAPSDDLSPSFDIVRISDLGDVLIAGRAPASSTIAALIDDDPVAQAVSSRAGEFVMMFALDPHPTPRILELEVRLPSGDRVRSADTLMLAPRSPDLPEADAPQPLQMAGMAEGRAPAPPAIMPDPAAGAARTPDAAQGSTGLPGDMTPPPPDTIQAIAHAPDTAQDSAALPDGTPPAPPDIASDIAPDPAQDIARAPTSAPVSPDLPAAAADEPRADAPPMAMLLRADGGVQVLGSAPSQPNAQTSAHVTIDSVVYDAEGEIAISGRSQDGASDIQIYLDNEPILRARASADGNWQAQLAGIERGVYRLRVDELDAAAQVISRAEIPFERVTPEIARTASGPQALIVQPGNTLWGMSEQQFGEGWRYMRIFNANRDQIRNPDLIFPGQVFVLPEAGQD